MNNKGRNKFKVGDIIVITMYGTVGTITKIHQIDQHFVYEVNHSDILYYENALELYSDFEGIIMNVEEITIDVHFQLGDFVLVKDYGKTRFKIVGIRTEVWRYEDDSWEEVIYELTRMSDGEWLEATEGEIKLLPYGKQSTTSFHHKVQYKKEKKAGNKEDVAQLNVHKEKYHIQFVDELLDIYNDYKALYDFFKNPEYKEMMMHILNSLRKHSYSDKNY